MSRPLGMASFKTPAEYESHSQSQPQSRPSASFLPPSVPRTSPSSSSTTSPGQLAEHDKSSSSGSINHIRSCVTCRRRKVRCNKQQPSCSNCISHRTICEYPSLNRPKRRRKTPADNAREDALLQQLRRLEGMVEQIGKTGTVAGSNSAPSPSHSTRGPSGKQREGLDSASKEDESRRGGAAKVKDEESMLSRGFGKLIVDESGQSQYAANSLWTALNEELSNIRGLMTESSDDDEDPVARVKAMAVAAMPEDDLAEETPGAFMLSYRSIATNLRAFYPDSDLALKLWEVYKENVHRLVVLHHIPTFEKKVLENIYNPTCASREMEAMMFAVYYSAIVTLSDEQCCELLGEKKPALLERYQFAVEQALARANYLTSKSMLVLQAFTQFLISVRFHLTPHAAWSYMGMVNRAAISLGIHRDGSLFDLDPFDTELRRRLWWQIVVLDCRINEDFASDAMLMTECYDTKMLCNINDADMWPGMVRVPKQRKGFTDSSFPLLRSQLSHLFRRLLPNSQILGSSAHSVLNSSLAERCSWIENLTKKIESEQLKHFDLTDPFQWGVATVTRLILAKLWLIAYQPLNKADENSSPATNDRLFEIGIDVVEYSRLMMSEKSMHRWSWMSRTYVQWHVVAFVLQELRTRVKGPDVDRAWVSVVGIWKEWDQVYPDQKSGIWKPLRWILSKARAARRAELEKQQAVAQLSNRQNLSSVDLGLNMYSATSSQPFSTRPPAAPGFQAPDQYSSSTVNNAQPVFDPFMLGDASIFNPPDISSFDVSTWDQESAAAFAAMYGSQSNGFQDPNTHAFPSRHLW